MVPNLPRKLFGIALVSVMALWSILAFDIRLGLDLSGGSRIVYKIDFDQAIEDEQISPDDDRQIVLQQTAAVFQERLDANDLSDVPIYPQGSDQIVVELPDRSQEEVEQIKRLIISQGSLGFRIVLSPSDDLGYNAEVDKYRTWRTANPEARVLDFNRLEEAEGGPRPGVQWFPLSEKSDDAHLFPAPDIDAVPLRNEDEVRGAPTDPNESWNFAGADIARVFPGQDRSGFPAVGYELVNYRKGAYADFTGEYKGRLMAITLSNAIYSAAEIQGRIPGQGIITGGRGGFAIDEVEEFLVVLKTGSLRIEPILDSEAFVGPSLGKDAISTGVASASIGLGLVFIFMLAYYWMNGIVASLALAFNGFILVGALYFTQATLTLPGLAGLVLTIGMAVDANILIFERVREEIKRGRETMQAYKNGYENAFSTIVDANLTTLITGVILGYFGTGPVKGFASTLSLGVVASMFSALVFSKVIMHWLVFQKRQIKEVKMAKPFLADKNISFTSKRKTAGIFSAIVVAAGVGVLAMEWRNMLGIDFAGGFSAQVNLSETQSIEEIRGTITASGGESYDVLQVQSRAEASDGESDSFLIKRKFTPEERTTVLADSSQGEVLREEFLSDIRSRLAGSLDPSNSFEQTATVGARVSTEIRDQAVKAIFLALLSIVIYMNFRFKEYRYGIAAVIAVFHDVLVTLGMLALASKLGLVQVELNLEMVAAFLTIIGYSLNDTIVVFDRIRENIPRRKRGYAAIIDLSINQSLSRTVLTSVTTFIVVLILFLANRPMHNVLEGFSFAMLVGVIVGTYSSMFIASPALIFLDRWARKQRVTEEKPAIAAS